MILSAQYARENNVPYFGIGMGMQAAIVDFARNVCGLENANSIEFDPKTPYPVVNLIDTELIQKALGGTLRLGNFPIQLTKESIAHTLYEADSVLERHRHRYEFNNVYRDQFIKNGFVISGQSPNGQTVEIIEYKDHPFFVGTQYQPEFKSRPNRPHPLFKGFIKAAWNLSEKRVK